jgi:amino acid adenylation domain-containing protein
MPASVQKTTAVLGFACRFPGAPDAEAFWALLEQGGNAITETPPDRWNLAELYDQRAGTPGKLSTRHGGFIERYDRFDAEFFGMNPREASATDPQQRVLLELTWQALENAAIDPKSLAGSRTGVFACASNWDYNKILNRDLNVLGGYAGPGSSLSIIANRISYFLDLRGPSLTVDTTCSSSLVAMHLAIQSLASGEIDLAIVGAVNLMLSPEVTVTFSSAGFMSPTGRCKTFSADADGFVRSEGAGVMILRRLEDAQARMDPIAGVLRGIAVNQDGQTNGLTSPNGFAQQAVIREALARAGVDPSELCFAETHGTGTPLGDPIEAKALRQVLSAGRGTDRPCALGSVKANIGHCEAAAGMAGMIKVLLAMRHGRIPPQPPIAEINPLVASALKNSALHVARELLPWERTSDGQPRIASVSSFGFGGTNAYAVVQEPPLVTAMQGALPAHHVLKVTADSSEAMVELARSYRSALLERVAQPEAFADFCYTANAFRSDLRYRSVAAAATPQALCEQLEQLASRTDLEPQRARPRLAFLFPGQGSQYPAMGRGLYASEPVFREAFDRCAARVDPELTTPLAELLFRRPDASDGALANATDAVLNRALNVQPAVFAVEYGLAQLMLSWGLKPRAVLGHSLGEYVACCVAGVFSLGDALRLVMARARLMAGLTSQGAMLALSCTAERAEALIAGADGLLSLAALNGPENVVVSGERSAITRVASLAASGGIEARALNVAHAFHSPLMEPIVADFAKIAQSVTYRKPELIVACNLGGVLCAADTFTADYFVRHLREPVAYGAAAKALCDSGVNTFLELGPRAVLSTLGRQAHPQATFVSTLRPGLDDQTQIYGALHDAYVSGLGIDWRALYKDQQRRRVHIPCYPFQGRRHWVEFSAEPMAMAPLAVPTVIPILRGENRPLHRNGHPLIGEALVISTHPGLRVWERAPQPTVLSAGTYLEMALAAAAELFAEKPFEVADLFFAEVQPAADEAAVKVQLVAEEERGRALRFRLASQGQGSDSRRPWTTRANWTVRPLEEREPDADLSSLGQVGSAALLGAVGYFLHPTLLDACFERLQQSLLAPGESWEPVALEALQFHRRAPSGPLLCQAKLVATEPPRAILRLTDESGAVVATLRGLCMRRTERRLEPDHWLAAAEDSARHGLLVERLRAETARVLRVPVAEIDRVTPFSRLGMDSLMGMEMRNRMQAALGLSLPAAFFITQVGRDELARLVLELWNQHRLTPAKRVPPLQRRAAASPPLSYAQERMWFVQQLAPESSAYNVAAQIHIRGPLDRRVLERCLDAIVERHEVLRTTFRDASGVAHPQRVVPRAITLTPQHVRDAAELRRCSMHEATAPFDLAAGPLLRARLLRLEDDQHVLVLSMHHIATDGWSFGVLFQELCLLYRAFVQDQPSPLPELAVQYGDYAAWQREWLRGEVLEQQLAFWKNDLEGAPLLELPTDRVRPPVQSFRGARFRFAFGKPRVAALRRLCEQAGTTLFIPLFSAFAIVLQRYSGQDDLVIGTLSANRTRVETEGLIGFFVNALPVRLDLSGDPEAQQLLGRIRERVLAVTAHQDVPFEQIVEATERQRDPSRNPGFQVQIVLQRAYPALELPGCQLDVSEIDTPTAKRDLTLTIFDGETLEAHVEYATDLFDSVRIERLVEHLLSVVDAITEDPARRLSALPMLSANEQHWYSTRITPATSAAQTIHALFEESVDRAPDALAIRTDDVRLTYRQLDQRANQLARWLCKRGVRTGTAVGLCVGRSPEMLIGLFGILKAGAVYVPLDPAYPQDRRDQILTEAGVSQVLDHVASKEISAEPADRLATRVGPTDLAYVITTSGSTGRAKGVAVNHGSVVEYASTLSSELGLGPNDITLHTASISFSSSIRQAVVPLSVGATIAIADSDERRDAIALLRRIRASRVTVVDLVPTVVRQLCEALRQLEPRAEILDNELRLILTASEPLHFSLVRELRAALGKSMPWINMYGQTETTGIVSLYPVPEGDARGLVPIGRPRGNVTMLVLDRQHRRVPCGVVGELYIGGPSLAQGYLSDPALTAARFAPSPWVQGERLYASGDLVRLDWDGTIEFVGRTDQQVKIRGLRIEPAEIEHTLREHPEIRETVVLPRADGAGGQRLVAYFTARAVAPLASELRAHLSSKLPEAMIPSAFVALDRMPLTSNGKLDRAALPEPAPIGEREIPYVAPSGRVEEALAEIWREVLRVDLVSANDNFFALGGHSLLAAQVKAKIQRSLGVEVSLRALFEDQTLSASALRIEASAGAERRQALPPLVRVLRSKALPASYAQELMWRSEQAEPALRAHWIEIGVRIRGALEPKRFAQSVSEVLQRHEALRTVFRPVHGSLSQVILPFARKVAITDAAPEWPAVDLTETPPVRAALVRRSEQEHTLLLGVHRILADGRSMRALMGEIVARYQALSEAGAAELVEPELHYGDFAAWERSWLTGSALAAPLAFFQRQLAPGVVALRTDRPRPAQRLRRGERRRFALPPALAVVAEATAARERASLYAVLLAAFASSLGRYSGEPELVIGCPVSRTTLPGTQSIFGPLMNFLPLRLPSQGRPHVPAVKGALLAALDHQDAPFSEVLAQALEAHGPAAAAIGEIAFVMGDAVHGRELPDGLSFSPEEPSQLTSRRELTLEVNVTQGEIQGALTYDRDLFEADTIARILADLEAAIAAG